MKIACGTHGEYAVLLLCPTACAVQAMTDIEETKE